MLYTLMMLFIIIPMVGLAIDAGIMYTIKAKLQGAVDGASLGAARSLNRGQDLTSQQTAANDTATRYYHANFPANWMGVTTVNDPTITWPTAPPATAIINIAAAVDAPTWFMRILGFNSVHLTAVGEATRRNVDIMLVIDRSTSLSDTGSCPSLKSSAQLFVNSFSNNRDIIGMVTFGTYYHVDFAPVTDFQDQAGSGANSLSTHWIPQLVCAGFTNTAAAMSQAYATLKGLNDQNALNVILLFTDGQPNTVTFGPDYGPSPNTTAAVLPVKTSANGGTCVLSSGHTGLSGTIAGDVGYGVWGGIYQAWNSAYPVATGGDFGSGNWIGSGQGRQSGCSSFVSSPSGSASTLGNDIGNLPSTDSWNNSINSTWSGGTSSGTGFQFPETVSITGSTRFSQTNLQNAGINALDNAAQNARVDALASGTPFVIYTIGLGNASGGVPDELLRRVANDPTSKVYSTTYPSGIYVSSPDTAHLSAAFATIADDIMRISK
jgi:hypothetical protein